MQLGHPHGVNVHPRPFCQCEATLNTICCGMKSTPGVEVCCPIVVGIEQVDFGTPYIGLRHVGCWYVPAPLFKYKPGSDRDNWDLLNSPTEF